MRPLMEFIGSKRYGISDLAALYGISLRTLRFYEERELLRPRHENGRRVYTDEDRRRLEIILKGKRLGFSLAIIWTLLENRPDDAKGLSSEVNELGLSQQEIHAQIDRLSRERERVVAALDELREVAARSEATKKELFATR